MLNIQYFLPWKFRKLNIKFQEIEGKVVTMLFNVTEARIKAFEEMMGKHLPAAFISIKARRLPPL